MERLSLRQVFPAPILQFFLAFPNSVKSPLGTHKKDTIPKIKSDQTFAYYGPRQERATS